MVAIKIEYQDRILSPFSCIFHFFFERVLWARRMRCDMPSGPVKLREITDSDRANSTSKCRQARQISLWFCKTLLVLDAPTNSGPRSTLQWIGLTAGFLGAESERPVPLQDLLQHDGEGVHVALGAARPLHSLLPQVLRRRPQQVCKQVNCGQANSGVFLQSRADHERRWTYHAQVQRTIDQIISLQR